ncbi:hypothetical protein C8Q75DRAFT_749069 [Abortiporus biennis]|nr:hypothetical protein C8Q75DRAFT_749069 [Abortiporus biennis]
MTTVTPSLSPPSSSQERLPKFREHLSALSIYVPPLDTPIESSRFSPESPPPPPTRTQSIWTTTTATRTAARDIEMNVTSPKSVSSNTSKFRDRFTKLWFDVRMLGREREPELPIQEPSLPPWSPLHIEKRQCCQNCPCHNQRTKKKKSKRDRIIIYVLIFIVLYLLGNTVFLDVRVLSTSSSTPPTTNSTSTSLSADAQQCLSQYNVNAPSNPSGYPCSSCLPVLQAVPSDFSDGKPEDAQQIQNAIQFCGLRSIFDSADDNGQSTLKNGGWVDDVRFCAWNGVSCDGSGRVASLTLTFPAVPVSVPDEIGALTGLQALHIIGNSATPSGSLPSSFTSLTSLSTLHLESTSITALSDNFFSTLKKLTTLELVKNSQMTGNLPSSINGLSLQNLVVNGQTLANPLANLASSSSLQSSLQLLDLSSSSLSGVVPSSISSFSALVELHLDSNSLNLPLPSAFPANLVSLSMSNNTGLSGSFSGSFCSLGKLQNCDMTGTNLQAAGGCSVCRFS